MITDLIDNIKFIVSFVFSTKFIFGAFVAWLITNFIKNRVRDREIDEKKEKIKQIISSKVKTIIKNIEEKNYMDQDTLNAVKNIGGQGNIQLFEDKIEEIKEDISIEIEVIQEAIEEDIDDWNV